MRENVQNHGQKGPKSVRKIWHSNLDAIIMCQLDCKTCCFGTWRL